MSLLTSLISYWKMDTATGAAADSHGSNTLTASTPEPNTSSGIINTSRIFVAASKHYFSHSDNADLSLGSDQDFTIQAWVFLATMTDIGCIVAKWSVAGTGTDVEYLMRYVNTSNRFDLFLSNGTDTINVVSTVSLTTGVWYLVHSWHDSAANQVGISVNAGTPDTASWSSGTQNTSHDFAIGRGGGGDFQYLGAAVDEVALWKRVLTGAERTELYNGGAGKPYTDFGAAGNRRRRALIAAA